LLIVGRGDLALLDDNLAVLGRRGELDRWQWSRGAIRPDAEVNSNPNICVRLPGRCATDRLDLRQNRPAARKNNRSDRQRPALQSYFSSPVMSFSTHLPVSNRCSTWPKIDKRLLAILLIR
jgi:hypothetical protein